ncbi:hypothetical protein [Staphylococcus massiliensis]|nr:hypothetical protein [Staphylococcus massiliensis]MCG3399093.1 hypothetical protein [Staphylococcus massiliensis]MCG3400909.1 hypothetical protein [Staphylococcus massiliensis]MCG3412446.1 hypothetical protein [Staphylococcus massiliensis]
MNILIALIVIFLVVLLFKFSLQVFRFIIKLCILALVLYLVYQGVTLMM